MDADHSNISDWIPASLDEALQILDDGLQESSVVVIVIIAFVLLVLALLPSLLSGFAGWRAEPVFFGGVEERGVRVDGCAGVVVCERGHGVDEVGEIDEMKHNIMIWMAIIGGIRSAVSGPRCPPASRAR